jgi:ketosteroid isomerase-like protein
MGARAYGNPSGKQDAEVAIVRAIYDAFNRDDVEKALELISEDVEVMPVTAGRAGRETPYVGHDGVRQFFADAKSVWDSLGVHADDVRSASGGVVVFGYLDGVPKGSNNHERIDVIWFWRLRDGLATSMHVNVIGAPPQP